MTRMEIDLDEVMESHEAPERPDKLFVPQQLASALQDLAPDGMTVEVNERFSTTYARVHSSRDGCTLEVSWSEFEDHEHYEDSGWEAVCAFADSICEPEPSYNGEFSA